MENKEIIVTGCHDCPFEKYVEGNTSCNLDEKKRETPIMGTPDWCPLNTQVLTIRLDKPMPEFEEGKPRIKEV